jgi:hypothetical protein
MIETAILAEIVTDKIYELDPSLHEKYGEKGKKKCLEDNHHHFKHLHTAWELNESKFFTDYAIWLDGILTRHEMTTQHLLDNFDMIGQVLRDHPESGSREIGSYLSYLSEARSVLTKEA